MITKLHIEGFRCFRELRVEPLTRVNLFVGQNNAGKTSLLEAVEMVAIGSVEGLVRSAVRRGENVLNPSGSGEEFKEYVLDLSHLFVGHELQSGKHFMIEGFEEAKRWVQCMVDPQSDHGTAFLSLLFRSDLSTIQRLTISPYGGIRQPLGRLRESAPRVNFVRAESVDLELLGKLWDALVLTPEEEEVISSLRIIEPCMERLAVLREGPGGTAKFLLKLAGVERRLPIGSLGGGVERFLALVLNLIHARDGFLLVDEIDTGLHYSMMLDMWRLIVESARRLDVQVFATTHSLDCVRALARLRKKYPELAAEVTLHRVEKDAARTTVYDADELVIAADSQLEVR